jgi:hypothetical protein
MFTHYALVAALATTLAGTFPLSADANSFTGRVTAFSATSLSVNDKEIVTLTIDERTVFTKWITRKPWGEDTRLDARAVHVGTLVSVHVRKDDGSVADWVQVATDMPVIANVSSLAPPHHQAPAEGREREVGCAHCR